MLTSNIKKVYITFGDENMNFQKRLKELREEKGITQVDLAKALKTSQGLISQYESGAKHPGLEVIKRIAKFFNVSTDYLIGDTDDLLLPKKDITNVKLVPSKQVPLVEKISSILEIPSLKGAKEVFTVPIDMDVDFAYKIKDDSMEPDVNVDGVILISTRKPLENGNIILAYQRGKDTICRRYARYDDVVILKAKNEKYEDIVIPKNKWKKEWKIIGIAVARFERF